jgi:hypothetical protein
MFFAGIAPPLTLLNDPPTNSAGPVPSSWTASALTSPLPMPAPSALHAVPSHAAMREAGTPPAVEKVPPTTSFGGCGPPPSKS